MTTLNQVIELAKRMIDENEVLAKQIGAVYKFILHGEGGGTFVIDLRDNLSVTESNDVAQCTLTMSVGDFVNLFEGRADSRHLFFAGRMKVEGNIGLGLKLKKLFDAVKKRQTAVEKS